MNSNGFFGSKSYIPGLWVLAGRVYVDVSGDVLNQDTAVGADEDADGDPIIYPTGFSSIAKTGDGEYRFVLRAPAWKVIDFKCEIISPTVVAATGQVRAVNPKGATVGSQPAQTIDYGFHHDVAVPLSDVSFFVRCELQTTNVQAGW